MKPLLLAVLLVLGAANARSAEPSSAPDAKLRSERQERKAAGVAVLGAILPFIPPKWALDNLAPQTFSKWPYRGGDTGYLNAAQRSVGWEAEGSTQWVINGGRADHAEGHLRTESRIGIAFSWSAYEARALSTLHRADFLTAHLTTSLLEREDVLFESGFGGASMQRDETKMGASWIFNLELYRTRPFNFKARYCPSILLDGRIYHDLRASAGASYGPFGLSVGARAFLNPLRNAFGPEGSLKLWF